MAIELPAPPFTIFSPKSPSPRPPSELRFSRWNNANAQPFIRKQREIKEIEDDLRRERRFTSASKIAETHHHSSSSSTITTTNENFKSIGTPSAPSRSSIPGKSSKYSKPPKPNPNPNSSTLSHPAFSPQISKPPKVSISKIPAELATNITIGEDGVSYKIPNAPFEFQYSYTETPKVKPLALREPPFVPFGPSTMARPWTGKAPLTKKKLPEFDSFKLPPAHKKGVKPVQSPGPFLAGMGPKYVKTREEIMGEPLTEDEVKELVEGCLKSERQLNMGRDGLTHNMLDNIHAHWKRRRVCKIKCKGVCTVDMDNVRGQLEDKTGGKIIYSKGGVLFLYRGRNYNYRTRPRFPLMLWKPVTPVYPRLIKQPPEGLTMEEAKEMRKRGRVLPPICKLGKNGVYSHLIKHVREAFEECELVRINCQGMNGSDYRKIGGKLQDLVPCVLLSFEYEHILMWRGRDWKSSFPKLEDDSVKDSKKDDILVSPPNNVDSIVEQREHSDWFDQKSLNVDVASEMSNASLPSLDSQGDEIFEGTEDQFNSASEVQFSLAVAPETLNACVPSLDSQSDATSEGTKDELHSVKVQFSVVTPVCSSGMDTFESSSVSDNSGRNDQSVTLSVVPTVDMSVAVRESLQRPIDESESASAVPKHSLEVIPTSDRVMNFENTPAFSDGSQCPTGPAQLNSMCMNGVILLRSQAIESGSAVILDDASLDASVVYDRAVALAKAAPRGPVFKHGPKKVLVHNVVKQHNGDLEASEVVTVTEKRTEKNISRNKRLKDFKEVLPDTLPHGSLGVDELAKLLA